jgi:hypothetical protein
MTQFLQILFFKYKSSLKIILLDKKHTSIENGRENVIKHVLSGGPKKNGKSTPQKSRNGLRRTKVMVT